MTEIQEIAIVEERERLVVHLASDVTLGNVGALRATILAGWRDRLTAQEVLLDMALVRHIDSSGIGLLLELISSGIPVILCGLRESPRRLLNRIGLASRFEIYSTVEDAENAPPHSRL